MTVNHVGTKTLPVTDLHPHPDNPNRGNVDAIRESLDQFGQYRAVVALTDGTLLAGHHVWQAAKARGQETIRVEVIDTDPQTAKRILLADNRIAELGEGIDPEKLYALLSDDLDMTGTGYDADYLADLEALLNPDELVGDPDTAPPVPRAPGRAKTGQAWQLGPHRLWIGDSTDTEGVLRWLAGDRADCVWTDPPYGVDYVGKTKESLTIENDGAKDLPALLAGAYRTILNAARAGAPVYVACPPGPEFAHFCNGMLASGIQWRQTLAWVKNTIVLGRSDYHYRHESILYGFTPGQKGSGRLGRGGDRWFGDNSQATTLFYDKPPANKDHPTMKPVDLIGHMLGNSCPPGGLVFDPFGGSGSTMAAAHVTGRRAALVELDPKYGEVILERYEAMTGDTAQLVDDL
ncbi:DNA methyltransferase [Gordonia phage Portcullis]|uniref:DNA methylase n=1 Tax=Gordonia phage Portcullis TaxID=2762414 RepID=A0A7G8LGM4_9CAUD|nr:DNA methyltransferase [Gordonia phage Portcullis]QNJ56396.1 DNA methylase [Gordonia phage Portcullis]